MIELAQIALAVVVSVMVAFGVGRVSGQSAARRKVEERRLETHKEMRRNERDAESQDDGALAERITRRGL